MQPDVQRASPVRPGERILFIDILRGMALFGILAANMRAFFAPQMVYGNIGLLYRGTADLWVQGIINALIQVKFITIFSFLFGMGFAIQMSRAEQRGARFLSFYPRRLLALAFFGLVHGILIWHGDILLTYALSGAMLLLFRKCRQKTLLWWAGGLISLPLVLSGVFACIYYSRFRPQWMNPKPPDMNKVHWLIQAYSQGNFRQVMAANWYQWLHMLPTQFFAIYLLSLFLLGMWVWRSGVFDRLQELRPVFVRVCAWCLPIGLALNIYIAVVLAVMPHDRPTPAAWIAQSLYMPGAHILSAGYVSGVVLLYLNADWRRWLTPFAAVGRMALTNYLLQSVVCTLFFYHLTSNLYGKVGPAWGLAPTVVLFSAQVAGSNWWLRRYRFGPMEWLWRWMTYGNVPALRHEEPQA